MPDLFRFNPEMRAYYRTLPPEIRDRIAHSAAKLGSLADLQALAETAQRRTDTRS